MGTRPPRRGGSCRGSPASPRSSAGGFKDPGYQAGLLTLGEDRFPAAEVHEFDDASHFVQEDAHERIVPLLIDFLRRSR